MPKPRMKPTNSYLEQLLQQRGFTNIKDAADQLGIPYKVLLRYADIELDSRLELESARTVANKFGIPAPDFVAGLLKAAEANI